MARVASPDCGLAPQIRIPGRKVLYHEQFFLGFDVVGYRVFVECACIVSKHVFADGGVWSRLRYVSCIWAQQAFGAFRASLHVINALYVSSRYRVYIVNSLVNGCSLLNFNVFFDFSVICGWFIRLFVANLFGCLWWICSVIWDGFIRINGAYSFNR